MKWLKQVVNKALQWLADSLVSYSEEHKWQCNLASSSLQALAQQQFEMNDLKEEISRLHKQINEVEWWNQQARAVIEEKSKENEDIKDMIKYTYHTEYIKDVDKYGFDLYERIKRSFTHEQKKLIVDYLDYYKHDYIAKSMNQIKDLTALQYRNGSLGAIASLKKVMQNTIMKKETFDPIEGKMKWRKVKDEDEEE
jgi:hypothetical protein